MKYLKRFNKIDESVNEKTSTAEEIYNDFYFKYKGDENFVLEAMKEFAKYHVRLAVKEQIRLENDRITSDSELDKLTEEALKRTYPLENIK